MLTNILTPPEPESLDATVIVTKVDPKREASSASGLTPNPSDASSVLDGNGEKAPHKPSEAAPIRSIDDGVAMQQDAEQALLRARLQTASIISLICMTAFFLRSLFSDEPVILIVRSVALIITVGVLGLLVTPHRLTTQELRRLELSLFGPLCALVVFLEIYFLHQAAAAEDAAQQVAVVFSGTLGLAVMMLTYGMLMPNGWRRTAVMMLPPIIASVGVLLYSRSQFSSVAQTIDAIRAAEAGFALILTGVIATYGSYTISTLRREANRAKQLGRYHLKRELGQGGMGQVHLGEHQLLKRPCAIKVIRPGQIADRAALARFEREVQTTARLSHWNTIEIFDYGHTEDGTFYYVMEYMRGLSLADLVKRYGPQSPARTIHFLAQTCWALQEAHNHGLIHRDLKPANIFAAKRGGVFDVTKLFDFGLVLLRGEGDNFLSMLGPGATTPFAGSPLYMSPEQAVGMKLDARSDIYSLGGVAYYLLTGRPPFEGDSAWRVMVAHAKEPVTPPRKWNPSIPEDLEAVVLKCLSKEPSDRYSSPREMAEALSACEHAGQWDYEKAGAWWRERAAEIDPTLLDP